MAIYVTKSFLPPLDEYTALLKEIWDSSVLTNQGPLVLKFQTKLIEYLKNSKYVNYVVNGTSALQLAIRALDLDSCEIITTPFTYAATANSIAWEKCKPVFVDIDPHTLQIDASKIEEKITHNTKAILAVHVFGYPCDVDAIGQVAQKHNLKVIYDGSHAFGSVYKGKSLLTYGDITTCSFHATKLFHTVEGGACFSSNKDLKEKINLSMKFGHLGDEYYCVGINAKSNELHAAMGLAIFPYLDKILNNRKIICELYDSYLAGYYQRPIQKDDLVYNHAYYPIVFKSESELLKIFDALKAIDVYPRRYFYPSLNTLPFLTDKKVSCPVSEDIASRIACLPLYPDLDLDQVKIIATTILNTSEQM